MGNYKKDNMFEKIYTPDVLTEELMQLSIYNANRETELNNVWEKFSVDLESITEDDDGAWGCN